MACTRLCSAESVFVFINVAFAMYSGAMLSTAARLAWDPSTYTWFRFLCVAQYRACAGFMLACGVWLAALVCVAALRRLRLFACGVIALVLAEASFGAWLATSLSAWWQEDPHAELARRGIDLLHDIKPALLAVERYKDLARPLYDIIEEMEREAPNNAYVIIIFSMFALALQVSAVLVARKLHRREMALKGGCDASEEKGVCVPNCDEESEGSPSGSPGYRKQNLRMYTIIDKIF